MLLLERLSPPDLLLGPPTPTPAESYAEKPSGLTEWGAAVHAKPESSAATRTRRTRRTRLSRRLVSPYAHSFAQSLSSSFEQAEPIRAQKPTSVFAPTTTL